MRSLSVILFGGTGDLSRKKLIPALKGLLERKVVEGIVVVGTGRRPFSDKEYLSHIGLEEPVHGMSVHYFRVDFTQEDSLKDFGSFLSRIEDKDSMGRLFYLATSPEFFKTIAMQLAECFGKESDEGKFNRLMVEKPFGHDLKSSEELNSDLKGYFSEDQIFRVDHYLGKEAVQNILVLRLANPLFENIWNSGFIAQINIIVSEKAGVGERMAYYDSAGALRDMVQNHMLQMLSFIIMEPPQSADAGHIKSAKADALAKLSYAGIVIGQYEGYRQEAAAINPDSDTESYAELELKSSAKRWKGTRIFLKTGKHLSERAARIEIIFKKEPCVIYCDIGTHPNKLVMNIQPSQDTALHINTKAPGREMEIRHVSLEFSHEKEFHSNQPESYETIFEECIAGDKTLFISEPMLRESWRIIDEAREKMRGTKPLIYKKDSEGPHLRTI